MGANGERLGEKLLGEVTEAVGLYPRKKFDQKKELTILLGRADAFCKRYLSFYGQDKDNLRFKKSKHVSDSYQEIISKLYEAKEKLKEDMLEHDIFNEKELFNEFSDDIEYNPEYIHYVNAKNLNNS